ncbi:MAG: 2-oxoisovalerate dehydrogenase [Myxococcota bacterium]|nr:2-oxoisovalerate dehydrogenase [Myxococcota bacterium]
MTDDPKFEFMVEQLKDGTYLARSFAACIFTEAATIEELREQICDAVCCHFDAGCAPGSVLLRFVEVVKEEIVTR